MCHHIHTFAIKAHLQLKSILKSETYYDEINNYEIFQMWERYTCKTAYMMSVVIIPIRLSFHMKSYNMFYSWY